MPFKYLFIKGYIWSHAPPRKQDRDDRRNPYPQQFLPEHVCAARREESRANGRDGNRSHWKKVARGVERREERYPCSTVRKRIEKAVGRYCQKHAQSRQATLARGDPRPKP